MESGIQPKESGIAITIGIQNSSSTNINWNPIPGIRNPKRRVQNPRLSYIYLHGAILNSLKCVLPASFRVALVCNYPPLCSLYASLGLKPYGFLCLWLLSHTSVVVMLLNNRQYKKTYKTDSSDRSANIPGGSCIILLFCSSLQK